MAMRSVKRLFRGFVHQVPYEGAPRRYARGLTVMARMTISRSSPRSMSPCAAAGRVMESAQEHAACLPFFRGRRQTGLPHGIGDQEYPLRLFQAQDDLHGLHREMPQVPDYFHVDVPIHEGEPRDAGLSMVKGSHGVEKVRDPSGAGAKTGFGLRVRGV